MPNEPAQAPKFRRLQTVILSLYDREGKPKDLAAGCVRYNAHYGEVVGWKYSPEKSLIYKIEMEDGKILELTEDCLVGLKGSVNTHASNWWGHGSR